MKPTPFLLSLYQAALTALALALTSFALENEEAFPGVAAAALIGIGFAHTGFWAMLIAYGKARVTLLSLAFMGTAALSHLMARVTSAPWAEWLGAFLLCGAMVCLVLLISTLCGSTFTNIRRIPWRDARLRPRQWSLASMVATMTSVCLLLGVSRLLAFPMQYALTIISYCFGFAAISLLAITSVLAERLPRLRLLATLTVAVGIGALLGSISGPVSFAWFLAFSAGAQCLALAGGAWCLRVTGHRLLSASSSASVS